MIRSLRLRPVRLLAAVLALSMGVVIAGPAGAQDGEVTATYELDGIPLSEIDASDPHAFEPQSVGEFAATVTNGTDDDVFISAARLRGRMLGMTFLSYDTLVLIDVPAGETVTFAVPVDLYDVDDQAVGYLRADLALLDADREPIITTPFAVDVRGRTFSAMGIFAFIILLVAVLSTVANLSGLVRQTLPVNRYVRGIRFAVSGMAIGFLVAAAFSILRVFPLPSAGWAPLVAVPTIVAFGFGYVLPSTRFTR
ncbi:MAG: hypothetical protein AAGF91_12730 [Actinomycetota bacterium]